MKPLLTCGSPKINVRNLTDATIISVPCSARNLRIIYCVIFVKLLKINDSIIWRNRAYENERLAY